MTDLVDHWGAVGSALGLNDHPSLPCQPTTETPTPPSAYGDIRTMEDRLREQDNKIGEILSIVKSLEGRLTTHPAGHQADSEAGTKPRNNKSRDRQEGATPPNRLEDNGGNPPSPSVDITISRYQSIYSTPSTVRSPIPIHLTPGLIPTPPPPSPWDDFPPLPAPGRWMADPEALGDGGRRPPRRNRRRNFPLPALRPPRPPALLVKGPKSYTDMVKDIKENMDPKEFDHNVHFNRSRKGELIMRFTNNETREAEIRKMKVKLSDLGSGVVGSVAALGRLDRILILDLDPSITEKELLEALQRTVPDNFKETIRVNGMWTTSSGYAKALASVPRGVLTAVRRIKVGFFLCSVQTSPPPPPRCYKCHDFGHFAKTCEGPDVRGTCRRCAEGHPTSECEEGREKCVACDRRGIPPVPHKPDSARCGARMAAGSRTSSPR